MAERITCVSLGSKNCCTACHTNVTMGYGPLCQLFAGTENVGEVCCQVRQDFKTQIDTELAFIERRNAVGLGDGE